MNQILQHLHRGLGRNVPQLQCLPPSPPLPVLFILFPLTLAKRSSRSFKTESQLPGSLNKIRIGVSFMGHIAYKQKSVRIQGFARNWSITSG